MTQLNTPYPSTAYLTGFLRSQKIHATQVDLALQLVLALLTPNAFERIRILAEAQAPSDRSASTQVFLASFSSYVQTIQPTLAFLQGRDATLSHRIASRGFLPEGPRFDALDADSHGDTLQWAFGAMGVNDKARHLATLYLNDLTDVLRFGRAHV